MYEVGSIFIYKTKEIHENILRWCVLCGLDRSCMAPTKIFDCARIDEGEKHLNTLIVIDTINQYP